MRFAVSYEGILNDRVQRQAWNFLRPLYQLTLLAVEAGVRLVPQATPEGVNATGLAARWRALPPELTHAIVESLEGWCGPRTKYGIPLELDQV